MNKSNFLTNGVFKVSNLGKKMFCPFCNSKLNNVGYKSLYTASSVSDNKPEYIATYCCSNKECEAFKQGSYWDENGDIYKWISSPKEPSALNSFARRMSVVIYKKDENFTLLNLRYFKITGEYKYEADDYGKILKRTPTFRMWTRADKHGGYQSYTSGIHMLIYCFKQFRVHLNSLKTNPEGAYAKNQIINDFKENWDKRWWKVVFRKYINFRYKQLYTELSNAM